MTPMSTTPRWVAALAITAALLASGCSTSSTDIPTGPATVGADLSGTAGTLVTKFDVISRLEPLTKAVVAYTESGDVDSDPASPEVLAQVKAKYADVQQQEDNWRSFTSSIDYSASDIKGLETALSDYNSGLDAWQAQQDRGLANWNQCVSEGDSSLEIAACMLAGYSLEDEQAALAAYTGPLETLLATLGIQTH